MKNSSRVFLSISIGDLDAYAVAQDEFKRAEAFLEANGAMVRIDGTIKANDRARAKGKRKLSLNLLPLLSRPPPQKKQLGLCPPLSALDKDSAALLLESYDADPSWAAAKGPARLEEPAPLLAGRLVVDLFDGDAPKACENFRALCTGEKGDSKACKKPLHYKGTVFHRIVKGFVCQGGDFVRGDGSGAESIFGGKFKDEPAALKRKHDAAGVIGMANSGKNGNGCQFYVTLAAAPRCDGKHVVVGRVVEGLEVLERIEAEAATETGVPRVRVAVADCGIVCE